MSKTNTVRRAFYTIGLILWLTQSVSAQSVLNFARGVQNDFESTGITIINPNPYHADVRFTLYGFDGKPLTDGLVNPVSYRIAPGAQLLMMVSEMFAGTDVDGWIQVTSPSNGLTGYYFSGNFSSRMEGSPPAPSANFQIVPWMAENTATTTELLVVNPASTSSSVTITIVNDRGQEVWTGVQNLAEHAGLRVPLSSLTQSAGGSVFARITSSIPVVATALVQSGDSMMFVDGQTADQSANLRVLPHFQAGNGFDTKLVLTNPNASPVVATVTLYSESGGSVYPILPGPSARNVTVPASGSLSLDAAFLTGLPIVPRINGWVQVQTANVQLAGLGIVSSGRTLAALPLQSSPSSTMLYSQITEADGWFSMLAFTNTADSAATVNLTLLRTDGTVFAERSIEIAARTKLLAPIREWIPQVYGTTGGFLITRSTIPLFSVELLGSSDGNFQTAVVAQPVSPAFSIRPPAPSVAIARLDPGTNVISGQRLRVSAINMGSVSTALIGSLAIPVRSIGPSTGVYELDLPAMEPGFTSIRLRGGGVETPPVELVVAPADNRPMDTMTGRAFYQKPEVTDAGLALGAPGMVPIRHARVEVVDRNTLALISVSESDDLGRFRVLVPRQTDVTIRVASRIRSSEMRVVDNTSGNGLYYVSVDVAAQDVVATARIIDTSRVSGAFNILEAIQRANELIRLVNPTLDPPAPTIFWSVRNTPRNGNVAQGLVGTTFFSQTANAAYILGDREIDSDEFDDAVILHEYAHMLAARFSRDDSPGGAHGIGDLLDPRLAWSEGFANFFSGAVRNDSVYRDSRGPNGAAIMRFDLEENEPAGDRPGYGSEASVHSILWDLFDDRVDPADNVQFDFSVIWNSFSDLRNERFIYLPYFLERFLLRQPAFAETIRAMAQLRSIDFQPNVRPSVTSPFPKPMSVGDVVTGVVDSFTSRRHNLAQSAHFYSFSTSGGSASVRLAIEGLGPGGSPSANDLDLFLLDSDGRVIFRSDRGLNGQAEMISISLPAGTYVIEVRSYYTRAETNAPVYNSGNYRLTVNVR